MLKILLFFDGLIYCFLYIVEKCSLEKVFMKLINMSISAGWLILAVLILRIFLKKSPKWVNVLLWGIVAVRLISPFSFESALSLIPSAETVPMDIGMDPTPNVDSGINIINSVVNPIIESSFSPPTDTVTSSNPLQIWIPIYAGLWFWGMVGLLIYTVASYWRLCRRVNTAVRYRDNIFQSENVTTPFVLGIIKPRIYLPFGLSGKELEYVVAHEQAHIQRKDHCWKPLGFLLLAVYWFNPLVWLAYILLCRDIEIACDERVIKILNNEQRADYTQALVACSVNHRTIAACPLAFGEVGVKERVKSVMNYKKPAFWTILLSVVACVAVAVCFLTNPKQDTVSPDSQTLGMAEADDIVNTESLALQEKEDPNTDDISAEGEVVSQAKNSDIVSEEMEAAQAIFDDMYPNYCELRRMINAGSVLLGDEVKDENGFLYSYVEEDSYQDIDDIEALMESVCTTNYIEQNLLHWVLQGDSPLYKEINGKLCQLHADAPGPGVPREIGEILVFEENDITFATEYKDLGFIFKVSLVKKDGSWLIDMIEYLDE